MGKIVFRNEDKDIDYYGENTKFTRMVNIYGKGPDGAGESLLFPIKTNGASQDTNLADYLLNIKEFQKTNVEIRVDNGEKDG